MPDDEQGQSESGQEDEGQQQQQQQQAQDQDDSQLGEAGLRALEREREARREAERKLKEAQEAAEKEKLSEKQRLEKERDEAKAAATKAEVETMRMRIGLKAGVPPEHIQRISGDTEDEIKADAEVYAKALAQQPGGLGGGTRGTRKPADMNSLIRQAAGRGPAQ